MRRCGTWKVPKRRTITAVLFAIVSTFMVRIQAIPRPI
jgi:hypothetical protein